MKSGAMKLLIGKFNCPEIGLKFVKQNFIYFLKRKTTNHMNNLFKTLIAGYGAKKLGGGCFGTIIVFVIIYWALGNFHC